MRILDIGCGADRISGAVGIDALEALRPDVVWRYAPRQRIPFRDGSFHHVYMHDFIEHVPDTSWLLREVHRVSTPDALVTVRYPRYASPSAYNDVQHVNKFGVHVLDHFCPDELFGAKYQYWTEQHGRDSSPFPFALAGGKLELCLTTMLRRIAPSIEQLQFNLAHRSGFYEHALTHVLGAGNVTLELQVLK